jgi:hypothetical protein
MNMTARNVAAALALTIATTACARFEENSDRAREIAAANRERQKESYIATLNDESKPASERLNAARVIINGFPASQEGRRAKSLLPKLIDAASIEKESRERSQAPVADSNPGWIYSHSEDKMTGQVTSTAEISSENQVSFGFPYAGEQRASLMLRKHPRYGSNVIFSIEKGQLLCRSYSGCPVRLRFDADKPYTVEGTAPADHSTEVIFIPGYKSIVSRLGKSKKLLIEVGVYQNGSQIFEFDITGFDQVKLSNQDR